MFTWPRRESGRTQAEKDNTETDEGDVDAVVTASKVTSSLRSEGDGGSHAGDAQKKPN
jgi:hypothetical protein